MSTPDTAGWLQRPVCPESENPGQDGRKEADGEPERIRKREGGYTLGEILIVIGIVAMILGGTAALARSWAENSLIATTERGIVTLSEALYNYRMIQRAWPGAMTDLATYVPTFSGGGRNGVGQPYSLDPPASLSDPAAPIVIETDLLDADRAEKVVREFPNTGTRSGTVVRVEVPVPGHEPAREAMLPRDGTRDMDGNLDMDGHDIEDVTAITVAGEDLTGPGVDFLNDLAALSCSGNQRVSVSGGTPRCIAVASTSTTTTITTTTPTPTPTPTPTTNPPPTPVGTQLPEPVQPVPAGHPPSVPGPRGPARNSTSTTPAPGAAGAPAGRETRRCRGTAPTGAAAAVPRWRTHAITTTAAVRITATARTRAPAGNPPATSAADRSGDPQDLMKRAATFPVCRPLAVIVGCGLALHLAWHFGPGLRLAAAVLFVGVLVALAVADIERMVLPDRLTLFLLWAGLAVNLQGLFASLHSAVIGAIAGWSCFSLMAGAWRRRTGRDGLGPGDCKLLAALGAWHGWELLPLAMLSSVAVQVPVILFMVLSGTAGWRDPVPYGPALAIGGWAALLHGGPFLSLMAA